MGANWPSKQESRVLLLSRSSNTIERLFSCGVEILDAYLHKQAGQDLKKRVAVPFVILRTERSLPGTTRCRNTRYNWTKSPQRLRKTSQIFQSSQ